MNEEIGLLVVGYMSWDETVAFLSRFDRQLRNVTEVPDVPPVRCVFWDNSSHALARVASKIDYVSSSNGNVGFAAAVNAARREAGAVSRVLLLNPDLELTDDDLANVLRRQVGLRSEVVWAPKLVNADGTDQTWNGSLFLKTWWQEALSIWGVPALATHSKAPRYYLRGAVFSISAAMFDSADGLDERYFLYGEEADLCFRLHGRAEFHLDDTISIVHLGSQGSDGKSLPALDLSLQARTRLQQDHAGPLAAAVVHIAGRTYFFAFKLKLRVERLLNR